MLLCRFCPFMICLNGGARGLSLMYNSFLFNSFNHIPIPFDTDSKADKPPAEWQFFSAFFSCFFFFSFPFSSFSPRSSSLLVPSFLPPFRTSLHFNPPPIAFLYVRIAAPERKETREPRWGFWINFMLERAPLYTRKADVTGDICCVMPWYGTVRAGIHPVRIMSWVFFCSICSFW